MHRESVPLAHGITLACRRSGDARARVLLLHGFPEAAFVWDEVMQSLAGRGIACLAPNLRGYAGSSTPPDVSAYRARHLLADIAALIERQGAPVDLVVAHDWGGAVGWALAAQRPEMLSRLLIVNSPHPATFLRELRDNPAQQRASAYMNVLCRPDAEQLLAENDYARMWPFFGDAGWLTESVKDHYREVWRQGLSGPLNYYRASPLKPATGADAALQTLHLDDAAVTSRVPTHVLWGEADHALLPGLLVGLERWVPRLTLQRLPEASHWLVHEQPQLVVAAILAQLG
jgi:pimeloyl-ACP methyl ester carboxylesterase